MKDMDGLELTHLTESERDQILSVLGRDENLRQREQERIRKLRTDVKRLRLKGVIKEGQDADKTCARCRQSFGWIFNKGAICPNCQHRVCDKCREIRADGSWLCVLCHKQMELEAMTNHWFYSKFRKSKRSKKTNAVISGTEIIRTSFRKPTRYSDGTVTAGNSLTEEVKRAIYNNNSPNKSPRHGRDGAHDGETSDTQSMEGVPSTKRHQNAAFPHDDDKQLLMELIKPRRGPSAGPAPQEHRHHVQVKKVSSNRYRDSDSDSDSAPSSPQMSSRNESMFTHTDSLRSSTRSSSAMSSEGRITIVTDMGGVSDMDVASVDIPYQRSPHEYNDYSHLHRTDPYGQEISRYSQNRVPERYSPQGSRTKSTAPNVTNHASVSGAQDAASRVPSGENLGQDFSASSDSDSEYTRESVTKIKFKRMSISRSRSPSPEQQYKAKTKETGAAAGASVANGHLAPPGNQGNKPGERKGLATAGRGGASPASSRHSNTSDRAQLTAVPALAVSKGSPRSQSSRKSGAETGEEEDNIDELFASHTSMHSANESNITKRSSNLLSPFSTSRESIASFYSDAGEVNYGKIPVTGDILFGLDYNYKNNVLEVLIKQCRELAPVDAKRKRSDPYVKTYLLPDKTKSGKRKTRVKKHTLNPTFEETLRYQITKSELENRTLWLTVWHNDTFGRNDFLGEVTIPMDDYSFNSAAPRWQKLMDRHTDPMAKLAYKGDLIVSLKFVTSDHLISKKRSRAGERGELHVLIKEARNLTAVRANGASDPFCKGYLLPEKTKNAKQKTPVKKRECNPRWNHTFVFEDIALADLSERSLELTVWDHDRFTSNDFLGGVRLGIGTGTSGGREVEWMDSQGEEVSIWQSMLDRPNCWIEGTLLLRPNMASRK